MQLKNSIEAKIYAVGTYKGKPGADAVPAVYALVNGSKWVIETTLDTMAKLAEAGLPVKNEVR